MTADPRPVALEALATAWLEAEDAATQNPAAVNRAVDLGLAYEGALLAATLEEKRIAWEAARAIQASREMGSREWAAARRVSELLRVEYASARELGADPNDPSGGSDPR